MQPADSFAETRIWAVHPSWTGSLILDWHNRRVVHEAHGSTGSFEENGNNLLIRWDRYPSETFVRRDGLYIKDAIADRAPDILSRIPDLRALSQIRLPGALTSVRRVAFLLPGTEIEVEVRPNTSDVPTYGQVFGHQEYASADLPADCTTILDLGANIGLASIFFAMRFPQARIVAVEPDSDNFDMLRRNVRAFRNRVSCIRGAAWSDDGYVSVRHADATGKPLGAWGVQVGATAPSLQDQVPGYRLATILELAGFETLDILKVDIEGAEVELFSSAVQDCLHRVGMIIVETHDRFRPGSDAAVRRAVQPLFRELPSRGENLFFVRR